MDGPDEPSMRHINRIESEGISNDAPTVFPELVEVLEERVIKRRNTIQFYEAGSEEGAI